MSTKQHHYAGKTVWSGNNGSGTSSYSTYSRNHEFSVAGKAPVLCSSDPNFRGDPSRYNPEELLLASLSNCHMLWYLHLCSVNGIVVTHYEDEPTATMEEQEDGSGRFTEAVLHPRIVIVEGDVVKAESLHEEAHRYCFIAQSVNFPVRCEGELRFTSYGSAEA